MATLPGAWRYRDSAGTGWPGVSILWLGEKESLNCNIYLSVATRKTVWADPSLRYDKQATNQQTVITTHTVAFALTALRVLIRKQYLFSWLNFTIKQVSRQTRKQRKGGVGRKRGGRSCTVQVNNRGFIHFPPLRKQLRLLSIFRHYRLSVSPTTGDIRLVG